MDVLGEVYSGQAVRMMLAPHELLRRLREPALPIGGVILDFAGVLYDDSAWQRWLLRLVSRMGLHTHYTAFFRLWRASYLERVRCGELHYWAALRQFLAAAGLSSGQIDEVEAAAQARWFELQEHVFALPGVADTLRTLAEHGVALGLVCSDPWYRTTIQRRLTRLRLQHAFPWILPAIENHGRDGVLLKRAVESMRLPVARLAYVGRDTRWLRVARRIGLRAIAFNYDEDAVAQDYIESFPQLLDRFAWKSDRARAG